jgi:putative addiction module component (TIGR02574 family)
MSNAMPEILAAALSLPDGERANIAYELLQSLKPPGIMDEDDEGFSAELQRRIDGYEQDPSRAEDWEAASQQIRDAIKQRRGT